MTDHIPKEPLITLTQYLEDNKDLLAILGVFVAVIGFSSNLGIKLIAAAISFFAFTCATLILIEFWRKKPKGEVSLSVQFFRISLFFLVLALFFYWFTIFDAIFPDSIFFIAMVLMIEAFGIIINKARQKYSYIENALQKLRTNKRTQIVYALILLIVIGVFARSISNHIQLPIRGAATWVIKTSNSISGPVL